jgi:hypothetical protein
MSLQNRKSAVLAQPVSSAEESGLGKFNRLKCTTAESTFRVFDDESRNRSFQSSDTPDAEALLTRARLSEALNRVGFPVSPKTLATKASRGGGPPYALFGRRPLYRWRDALSWAEGRLTAPRCSSSEGDATARPIASEGVLS